jgi:hypothetical protein
LTEESERTRSGTFTRLTKPTQRSKIVKQLAQCPIELLNVQECDAREAKLIDELLAQNIIQLTFLFLPFSSSIIQGDEGNHYSLYEVVPAITLK